MAKLVFDTGLVRAWIVRPIWTHSFGGTSINPSIKHSGESPGDTSCGGFWTLPSRSGCRWSSRVWEVDESAVSQQQSDLQYSIVNALRSVELTLGSNGLRPQVSGSPLRAALSRESPRALIPSPGVSHLTAWTLGLGDGRCPQGRSAMELAPRRQPTWSNVRIRRTAACAPATAKRQQLPHFGPCLGLICAVARRVGCTGGRPPKLTDRSSA